jgi:hypothetical protein
LRFGPFHRLTAHDPDENEKVWRSGEVWERPLRSTFASFRPKVKAWVGPLPADMIGYELYTDVEPDPGVVPVLAYWMDGRPGVITIAMNEIVAIPVIITKRRDGVE